MSSIPLHLQVCLAEEEFDRDMLDRLVRKAEAVREGSLAASAQVEEVVSQKILDILIIGKTDKPKELLTHELKQTIASTEDVNVEVANPEEQLEQRQNNRRGRSQIAVETDSIRKANIVSKSVDVESKDIAEAAPLDQRLNRRQRGAKSDTNEQHSSIIKAGAVSDEEKDLKFLENFEKGSEVDTDVDQVSSKPVVPVTIVGEDTKNLEDWLDDFLDD